MMETDPNTKHCTPQRKLLNIDDDRRAGISRRLIDRSNVVISRDSLRLNTIQHDMLKEYRLAVSKHPKWPTDPFRALAILSEEHGELAQAVIDTTYAPKSSHAGIDNIRREAQQLAAMCIRFIEHLDKYKFEHGEQA